MNNHFVMSNKEPNVNSMSQSSKSTPVKKMDPTGTVEDNYSILLSMRKYLSENKISLKILTPCFGGMCHIGYVKSLMSTVELFKHLECPLEILFCSNDSLVSRARNNLVALAMSDKETTHIMFIDNDISWNPEDIYKLILSNKPIIGGVYPVKKYNWNKLKPDPKNEINTNPIEGWISSKNKSQFNFVSDESLIQSKLLDYNINYIDTIINVENSIAQVRHLATGFMMIQRKVIYNMSAAFPFTKYVDDIGFLNGPSNDHAYALFDCGVEDGHYFSEDWMFCHRWSKMGGEIHIRVDIELAHTGVETYSGSYMMSLLI
jgi:hypothetical protein